MFPHLKKLDCRKSFCKDLRYFSCSSEIILYKVLMILFKYKYVVARLKDEVLNSLFVINSYSKSVILKLFDNLNLKISKSMETILDIMKLEYKYLKTEMHKYTYQKCANVAYERSLLFLLFVLLFVLCDVVCIVTDFISPLLLFLWWRNKIS
ncbi:hypothetical protein WA026_000271 [Henosepilachna vigintioctopunctata]|uniref:Uncharacterized protein n=1 Tax=Henosepilachna vigintioctopunctata TaxID=420089 RepID=A0AAW1UZX2_9CUCU